jgi:hypothetical protein
MELQLICHGMMLFWYRHPAPGAPVTSDGYQILIPQAEMNGQPVHELRLGLNPGAIKSHLGYNDLNATNGATQHLRLEFGDSISVKERRAKAKQTNLNFYRINPHRSVRRAGNDRPSSGVAFVIDIPYPDDEDPIRVTDYTYDPYMTTGPNSRVVTAFDIRPRRLVGARVFKFAISNKPITLLNLTTGAPPQVIEPNPTGQRIKLHLYSQSMHKPDPNDNHLPLLNAMLDLKNLNTSVSHGFDLQMDPGREPTHDPPLDLPPGLGFRDQLHLWEFHAMFPFVHAALKSGKASEDTLEKLSLKVDKTAYDPAECGQGGGCDYDPPEPPPAVEVQIAAPRKAAKPAAKKRKKR